MKNILIPTNFSSDTNHALQVAADMHDLKINEIVLISLTEISDSITELLFLSEKEKNNINSSADVLNFWNRYKTQHNLTANVKVHSQYGLSRPVFRQLMSRFNIGLAIVPQSFQTSKSYIHQFMLRLLNQCDSPVMLLPAKKEEYKGIQRALYLDETENARTGMVQEYPFHVIHQSMLEDVGQNSIRSIVDNMKIDLIVKGKRNGNTSSLSDIGVAELGLPVLTI